MLMKRSGLFFSLAILLLSAALPGTAWAVCCNNGAGSCCTTLVEETCTQAGLNPTLLPVCTAAGPPACPAVAAGQCQGAGTTVPALSNLGTVTLVLGLLTSGIIFVWRRRRSQADHRNMA